MLRHPSPTPGAQPPAESYREAPPPPDLAPYLDCLWTRAATAAASTTRVVPDGCVDLMWMTESGRSRLVLAGPDTRAHPSTLAPGDTIAAVRFAPGAAAGVLGVPLHALLNSRPEATDVWSRGLAESVAAAVAGSAHPERALAEAVAARITGPPDPAMRHVARSLRDSCHPSPVRGLAAAMGLSERQLHRRCTAAFGYGPKTLHRVLRFQAALAQARTGHDLARVAHESGYADQPHLAREVADLTGTSMSALLAG